MSFQSDPSEKPKWLQLWCSAVEAANVDPALAEFRHESLADKFNYEYSEKEAIVSSRLKKSNSVLTPRRASTEPPKAPTIGAAVEKVAAPQSTHPVASLHISARRIAPTTAGSSSLKVGAQVHP